MYPFEYAFIAFGAINAFTTSGSISVGIILGSLHIFSLIFCRIFLLISFSLDAPLIKSATDTCLLYRSSARSGVNKRNNLTSGPSYKSFTVHFIF